MTRDSKTISAVFMAVVLVLASGAAVSFAATANDGGANAVGVQDTTTEDGVDETTTEDDGVGEDDGIDENETTEDDGVGEDDGVDEGETTEDDGVGEDDGVDENETTEADGVDEDETAEQASITVDEQESDGETLVVDSVTVPEGGFVVIHEENWEDAPLSTVLGSSVYLDAGTHEDVELSLARPLEESQSVTAMLHADTNDNRVLDFVLSSGALDGPITEDESPIVDDAEVTVDQDTTTEEVDDETTTEEDVETVTTTEEDEVETVTTTEEDEVETVTTTEEDAETVTTTEVDETPTDEMQQVVFKVEEMAIDRWSFVVGDEETPDETVYVNGTELLPPDGSLTDERVTVDLAELAQQGEVEQDDLMATTTRSPEEIEQDIEENLSGDIPTVRYVVQNVNVENATLVVTVPEDMDLPNQPPVDDETTTEDDVETVTTAEEDEVGDETTTEEDVETVTTTEDDVETVTTTEEDDVETVTTTEEDEVETVTTTEDVVDEPVDADSFEVSELDAPESAAVGDAIDVSATISNPNDEEATQTVAFRLQGDVVAREDVTLDAGEETTVTFEVDTTGVESGEYVHGVYTLEFGELDVIVLDESADDEADAGDTATDEDATDGETTVDDATDEDATDGDATDDGATDDDDATGEDEMETTTTVADN